MYSYTLDQLFFKYLIGQSFLVLQLKIDPITTGRNPREEAAIKVNNIQRIISKS